MTHVKFNNRGFEKSLNNMIDELFDGLPVILNDRNKSFSGKESIPVNILESNSKYQLEVAAPGFEKNDFKVTLDGNLLTISGERKKEEKNEDHKQIRKEFSIQNFKRSFTIDEQIDATGIEASYVNGVLTLNLPKKTEVKEKTKEITIN